MWYCPPDGQRMGRLDPVFKADLPIREAQIIQASLEHIRVRFVPAPEYADRDGHCAAPARPGRGYGDRVGAGRSHPHSASGKF